MKPRTTIWLTGQPESQPNAPVIASATAIWPTATVTASPATRAKARTDSSMPTRNRSMITPSSASSVTVSVWLTRPKPVGPSTTPLRM